MDNGRVPNDPEPADAPISIPVDPASGGGIAVPINEDSDAPAPQSSDPVAETPDDDPEKAG